MANPCIPLDKQKELFGDTDISTLDNKQIASMLDRKVIDLQVRKRQTKLQAIAINEINTFMQSQTDKKEAFKSFFSFKGSTNIGRTSVEQHQGAVLGEFHSKLADMMEAYRPTKIGFSYDKTGTKNMVRELFGQNTGDAQAKSYAKAFKEVTDKARERFNKSGGAIGKLDDWNLPQTHSAAKMRKMGYEVWRDEIKPLIDREKMLDNSGKKISEKEVNGALELMYNRVTNEFYDLTPGKLPVNVVGKMANRHREQRFIHFKDGDSWLKYHEKYGSDASPFTAMTNHLDNMAREIGMMEKMGPNPSATFEFMADTVKKATGKRDADSGARKIWNNVAGKTGAENETIANAFATARNVEVARYLGSATLSALPDLFMEGLTAAWNGLPILRFYKKGFKNLALNDPAIRVAATRLGIVADYAKHTATAATRYTEVTGYGYAAKWADATIRASGLNAWTNIHTMTFKMEFLGAMADMANTPYKNLNRKFKASLSRYGINEADWGNMARSGKENIKGADYINPMSLDRELRDKIIGMIDEESGMAIPVPNARTRAVTNQGMKAGTVSGEMVRTMFLFRSFPVSILMGHLSRGMGARGIDRLSYLSSMFVGTTLLGMVAYQAKEVSKGREPISWDDKKGKLLTAGMLQGGGLGIFGDFLFSDQTRFGSSLGSTIGGPIVSDADKFVLKYVIGSGQKAIGGSDKVQDRLSSGLGKAIESFTPGQLWYTRLAMKRYLFDNLNKELDPKWTSKQRRMIRKRRKDFGNDYFWSPGK